MPVTLKIRTGVDRSNRNGVKIAEIAQDCGITMLTVHGRTRADKFNGKAEYDTLQNIVKAVDIPVIANGDIDSAEKAARVLDSTGAHGVMIGRAAQGATLASRTDRRNLRNGIDNRPCAEARLQLAREHCRLLYAFHGAVMGFKNREEACWMVFRSRNGMAICSSSALSTPLPHRTRRSSSLMTNPARS